MPPRSAVSTPRTRAALYALGASGCVTTAEPAYGGTIVNFDAAYGGDDAASDSREDTLGDAGGTGSDATCVEYSVPLYGGPAPICIKYGPGGGD
jgi:hypothetical protein